MVKFCNISTLISDSWYLISTVFIRSSGSSGRFWPERWILPMRIHNPRWIKPVKSTDENHFNEDRLWLWILFSLDWFCWENLNRKPWFLPLNMVVSCKFLLKPIHWFLVLSLHHFNGTILSKPVPSQPHRTRLGGLAHPGQPQSAVAAVAAVATGRTQRLTKIHGIVTMWGPLPR